MQYVVFVFREVFMWLIRVPFEVLRLIKYLNWFEKSLFSNDRVFLNIKEAQFLGIFSILDQKIAIFAILDQNLGTTYPNSTYGLYIQTVLFYSAGPSLSKGSPYMQGPDKICI